MILKIKSQTGWVMVNGLEKIEYGGPESKEFGFYINKGSNSNMINIPIARGDTEREDDDWYYPTDSSYVSLIKSRYSYKESVEVQINGRSKIEVEYLNEYENEIHTEPVIFMAWLFNKETGELYLFDFAYLLNDNGKTIEKIF